MQFLEGLAHLVAQGFRHTSLDCSSILMNLSGEVKIGKPNARTPLQKCCLTERTARVDCCIPRQTSRVQASDLAPVSRIMMELMQKYAKDDGAVGIDDLERWSACPVAIEFLSAITSASSFEELKKVCEPPSNFALNSLIVFSATLFDKNSVESRRSRRPGLVCSDIRSYVLLVHTELDWEPSVKDGSRVECTV